MAADDEALVRRSQAGDVTAYEELVRRFHGKAFGVAYGMLSDREDALDVVQEAFIKVHKGLAKFRGQSSFYTWLYRIVNNLCIDRQRKRAKSREIALGDEDLQQRATAIGEQEAVPAPDAALLRRDTRGEVAQALSALSANHRAVLLMREVEGLSYSEMAQAMACSKGTIMSRLFHGAPQIRGGSGEPARSRGGGDMSGEETLSHRESMLQRYSMVSCLMTRRLKLKRK